jgi:DKNYY family
MADSNNWKKLLSLLTGLSSISMFGCGDNYKKINGEWTYSTSDEYNGTRYHKIGANDATMTVLKDGWARDKDHIYCHGVPVKGADVATFQPQYGTLFARDKSHVFLVGPEPGSSTCEIIVGADPDTFKAIKMPYSRDKSKVFCGTVPMNVANMQAFEVLSNSQMMNTFFDQGSFLFEYGDAFKDFNVSKDQPAVTGNGAWARDGQFYYFGPTRMDQADYATFRVIDGFNSSDKNRKYMFSFPADEAAARRKKYMGIT